MPLRIVTLAALLFVSATAFAQTYPSKLIRIVSPYSGGSGDNLARLLAPKLNESLQQPVIVENRPGANAVIGTDFVAKAAPDGHTLLIAITTHVISPNLIATPYHPIKDFTPVAALASAELGLALNLSVPANTLQEFIALAKSKPGELNYATTQLGGNQHVAAELFGILTGAKLTAVPYKGGGEAMGALLGGHVQAYFGSIASLAPQMRSGKVKGIAVSGETRHPGVPQVPTFTQGGVPNFDVKLWYGILAPAGVPKNIVDVLGARIADVLGTPEFKAALAKQGLDSMFLDSEKFSALMRTDLTRYSHVIKTANIKVEQ